MIGSHFYIPGFNANLLKVFSISKCFKWLSNTTSVLKIDKATMNNTKAFSLGGIPILLMIVHNKKLFDSIDYMVVSSLAGIKSS